MFHDKCFNQFVIDKQFGSTANELECPMCKTKIKVVLDEKKIFSKSKYSIYQNDIRLLIYLYEVKLYQ